MATKEIALLQEDPAAIRESMREFSLSVERMREAEQSGEYVGKWVATYKSSLLSAETREDLLEQVDDAGFYRPNTAMQFIDDGTTVFVL